MTLTSTVLRELGEKAARATPKDGIWTLSAIEATREMQIACPPALVAALVEVAEAAAPIGDVLTAPEQLRKLRAARSRLEDVMREVGNG